MFGLEQQVEAEGFATVGWQDEEFPVPFGALGTRNGRDTSVHGIGDKMQKLPLVAASVLLCSPADGAMSDTSSRSRYETGKA